MWLGLFFASCSGYVSNLLNALRRKNGTEDDVRVGKDGKSLVTAMISDAAIHVAVVSGLFGLLLRESTNESLLSKGNVVSDNSV